MLRTNSDTMYRVLRQSKSTAIVFFTTSKTLLCPLMLMARATDASNFRVSTLTFNSVSFNIHSVNC